MRRSLVWSLAFMILAAALSLGATILTGHSPLLGLDLKGGLEVVLKPTGTATGSELDTAVSIIDRRVNGLGVSNSNVTRQGSDVVIELPGIKDSQKALAAVGETAQLFFRPVYCTIPAYAAPKSSTTTTVPKSTTTVKPATASTSTTTAATSTTTSKSADAAPATARLTSAVVASGSSTTSTAADSTSTTTAKSTTSTTTKSTTTTTTPASTTGVTEADCDDSNAAALPTTDVNDDTSNNDVILPVDPAAYGSNADIRYVLGPADMTGSIISTASAEVDTSTGQYSVNLSLNGKGSTEFDKMAATRYACYEEDTSDPPFCSLEAFDLDGLVESAPTFQTSSFNGQVSITGDFSSSQASALANVLKYGSLPVKFVPQSTETVSATIGSDSLRAGLLAGAGGLILVMLYMLAYYRALGLVVLVGLGVGGSILYSLISLLSATSNLTLSLAGVTGIIVSIGITVDSYVVYFERLKDEVRSGRTVRASVERSFSRAFKTVLTADLVSFMAALILYLLTIGDVRGFAFMLGLSTILDVVTAYLFIRPAVILVGRRRSIVDNRFIGISRGLGARTAGET